MYLSLPLPSTATRTMTVSVFYGDGSGLPMPYSVTVLKNGACKDLKLAVASACCLKDDEGLLLAEVVYYSSGTYSSMESKHSRFTKILIYQSAGLRTYNISIPGYPFGAIVFHQRQ